MYHTIKEKNTEILKDVKPPKGWEFSGDPSLLTLSSSKFDTYFCVINIRVMGYFQIGIEAEKNDFEWEVEERSGKTGIAKKRGTKLSNKDAKELAVKLAKEVNKAKFWDTFVWIIVAALLAGIFSYLFSKL